MSACLVRHDPFHQPFANLYPLFAIRQPLSTFSRPTTLFPSTNNVRLHESHRAEHDDPRAQALLRLPRVAHAPALHPHAAPPSATAAHLTQGAVPRAPARGFLLKRMLLLQDWVKRSHCEKKMGKGYYAP